MEFLKKLNTPFNWFFIIYALLGVYWMADYGVPLDELTQWAIGRENARFISGHGNAQTVVDNGFFGPFFELINNVGENIIFSRPLSDKIMLRHYVLFAFFLMAIRAFYFTIKSVAKVPNSAGIATVMFALYPVLFAHAHYNSKDTVFLIMVVYSIWFLQKYVQTGLSKFLIFTGIILGISATIRLTGVFVLAAVIIPILLHKHTLWVVKIKRLGILAACFILAYFAAYPYLWITPVDGIKNLLGYVSSNPWPWNTLAAGQEIVAGQLPWWYLPLWMGVTIPLVSIVLFVVGLFLLFKQRALQLGILNTVVLLVFLLPMLYFLMFRPTIYNGWRHMQFLIFPICFMAIHALNSLLVLKRGTYFGWILSAYAALTFFLWQPYGYAYFNEIYAVYGKPATYDQDYWGLSALQGMRWVAAHDKRDSIVISSFTESPELNRLFLNEADQKRFYFTRKSGEGDYEVEVRRDRKFADLKGNVLFTICPLKDTLVRVVKLKN